MFRKRSWTSLWVTATLVAGLAATLIDAALLQGRRSYFTGGFLSIDHVSGPMEAIGFLLASVVIDIAAAGVLVAGVLWLCGRIKVKRNVALAVAVVVACAPIVVTDFINYRLLWYLGDAFDVRLMWDLVGGDWKEIFAVSSEHLANLVWVLAGGGVFVVVVAWGLWRQGRSRKSSAVPQFGLKRILGLAVSLILVGTAVTLSARRSSSAIDNGVRRKPTGQAWSIIINRLSDVDGDGYGLLGRPGDPAPFDAQIYPWAIDIPGNGIDEDGVGGDLPLLEASADRPRGLRTGWQQKPNVVLVVLESLRADAVGAVVNGRSVTPELDALAASGVASQHVYSHNGYTVQSRHHLFSGSLTSSPDGSTLIDDFKANGYETAYFSAQDESFGGPDASAAFERSDIRYDARQDVDRRFTTFTTPGSLGVPYDVLNERVAAFLDSRSNDEPLFLYVNFYDTHFPYHHDSIEPIVTDKVLAQSDIQPGRSDELRLMYLNAVANVDRAVGWLIERATSTLGAEPAVIVTADHGESLFDEGFLGHGYALNDPQTRVPFLVSNLHLKIEQPFGQADLRGAISRALLQPAGARSEPLLTSNSEKTVFQYLGNIERPAQIAFTSVTGRTVYDFRSGPAKFEGQPWRRLPDLRRAEGLAVRDMIWTWERMVLAKQVGR